MADNYVCATKVVSDCQGLDSGFCSQSSGFSIAEQNFMQKTFEETQITGVP